jgi:type VI secretion system secreted protein Hcp
MAADYFLQITGISGESADSKHKGWIDVLAWSWSESNPGTHVVGGAGGAGKVQMSDLQVTTRMSKASPALFGACASGQHMKEAKLAGVKSGAMQQEFLTITLRDVIISSYATAASSGDDVMDSVSLGFSQIQVEYRPQKADGTLDTPVTAGWDAKTSKKL